MSKAFQILLGMCVPVCMFADNVVHPSQPILDRPTLTALGVMMPITGDDNFNASVAVRYRRSGTSNWSTGLPLFRVHPEVVTGWPVGPNFAGSILDLRPNTSYDIELHLTDPDGAVDQTFTLTATTRPIPGDPPVPRILNANDDASLGNALRSAQPGDIIQLADGLYHGTVFVFVSGTASNPIVIRGASRDGTIIDGGGCDGCNVLEFYGSYVHLERLTVRNAQRAIRFQSTAQGNVVRGIHITNVSLGINTADNSQDFYICDNVLEGRLSWPLVYSVDGGYHGSDDGIRVTGFGHVVCHNRISGFGDAMKTEQNGARAVDFYGNDILWTYDNGVELDNSEGNVRLMRNRFMNNYSPISLQPIYGGPAYILRNIAINLVDEHLKFHGEGPWPDKTPSGVLVYHNTFVKAGDALLMNTPDPDHYSDLENNLFIGKAGTAWVVNWGGPIDHNTFDYNAYYPDGKFTFNFFIPPSGYQYQNWPSWMALQSAGMVEPHGMLLTIPPFATQIPIGLDYTGFLPPQDPQLLGGSPPVDRGRVLPNINDGYTGFGPDLGALELGCPEPLYGPRAAGIDESNEPFGCVATSGPPPPPVSISLNPPSAQLGAGQAVKFIVSLTNTLNTAVTWTLTPNVGTIGTDGTYTAPNVIPVNTPSVTVQAKSVVDPTKSASATVTFVPISVSISPTKVQLTEGQPQKFTATVLNAANTGITWTATPAVGTMDQDGTYTAPSFFRASTPSVTIQATSVMDGSKSAQALVTFPVFGPPVPISVSVAPANVQLGAGQAQKFTATVLNANNTDVTWTVSPAVGTMGADGTFTAPTPIPANTPSVTIRATSAADNTKSGIATVSFPAAPPPPAPPISVIVAPGSVKLVAGQAQKFNATVVNTTNANVTWTVAPQMGSIASDGTYSAPSVAPATAQTVTVTATSVADNSKSGSAVVTLQTSGRVPIPIFSTGIGASGTGAPDGSVDQHYQLTSSPNFEVPGPSAYVANSSLVPFLNWIADGPNSKWISPRADAGAQLSYGLYSYRTTFDLSGLNPSTAQLSGWFTAKDVMNVFLNGRRVARLVGGAWDKNPFSITTGFVSGVNTLEFDVVNFGPAPTGLRVEVSGTALTN